jgi:hypothetical protein
MAYDVFVPYRFDWDKTEQDYSLNFVVEPDGYGFAIKLNSISPPIALDKGYRARLESENRTEVLYRVWEAMQSRMGA